MPSRGCGFLETVLQTWSKHEEAEAASGLVAVSSEMVSLEREPVPVQQVAPRAGKWLQLLG